MNKVQVAILKINLVNVIGNEITRPIDHEVFNFVLVSEVVKIFKSQHFLSKSRTHGECI